MIKVKDLIFQYDKGGEQIVKGISTEIRDGMHVGIIGPTGCGKTTFVRHLNGLLTPTAGEVWVDGMHTADPVAVLKIRPRVGMVFQNPDNQIVGMTVEEDVAFGPGNLALPPIEIARRVQESLAMVGMEKQSKRSPHILSNGEKQLVAIAGVLAMKPRHIILDEPTTYLDPSARERVLHVVNRLHKEGITIVHVTHDMNEIARADRIIVLYEGRIAMEGTPSQVFGHVERLQDLGVGIPKIAEILWSLRETGLDVRTDIFSVEEACKEISSLITSQQKFH
ncbi:MAG: energy-coupling factor transporter ATPase [Deltaproteobacteria bacterium]|nr:energy-coupling factor transporter ATPase [Deltaproteobacteria bacterium]